MTNNIVLLSKLQNVQNGTNYEVMITSDSNILSPDNFINNIVAAVTNNPTLNSTIGVIGISPNRMLFI
jgi:hypothetical protein